MAALLRPDQDKNVFLPGWLRGMCRVQYSVRNRVSSGYVPVERLGLLNQGDAKAQSNLGAMYGNGKASAQTTLAVIAQSAIPYSASPQDVFDKPPIGQFEINMRLCVIKETTILNHMQYVQFILPSGESVYSEFRFQRAITPDPTGDENCAAQGRSGSK